MNKYFQNNINNITKLNRIKMKTFESFFTKIKSAINTKQNERKEEEEIIMQTALPTHDVFDETHFKFELRGGPIYTDILVASATLIKGEMSGNPLPIHCKWYTIENLGELKEIEGVNGAFFQPNVDDVGKRICVHAIPASDVMEYHGMPAFQEVGPLTEDPAVFDRAKKEAMASTKFSVTLEDFSKKLSLPIKKCALIIEDCELLLEGHELENPIKIKYSENRIYPTIRPLRTSGQSFLLTVDSEGNFVELSADSSTTRDIITLIVRKKVANFIPPQIQSPESLEIDKLKKECEKFQKEIKLLKAVNKGYMEQKESQNQKIFELEQSLSQAKKETENIILQNKNQIEENTKEKEYFQNELIYLDQDRQVIQQKYDYLKKNFCKYMQSVKKLVGNGKDIVDLLKKHKEMQIRIEKLNMTLHDSTLRKPLEIQHDLYKEESDSLRKEIDKLRPILYEKEKDIFELKKTVENYIVDLNVLKKKYDSLLHEKSRAEIHKQQIKEKERSLSESKLIKELTNRSNLAEEKAFEYASLSESYRKALNEEIKKSAEMRRELSLYQASVPSPDFCIEAQYRKIINSLTEMLHAKETEMANIKAENQHLRAIQEGK